MVPRRKRRGSTRMRTASSTPAATRNTSSIFSSSLNTDSLRGISQDYIGDILNTDYLYPQPLKCMMYYHKHRGIRRISQDYIGDILNTDYLYPQHRGVRRTFQSYIGVF